MTKNIPCEVSERCAVIFASKSSASYYYNKAKLLSAFVLKCVFCRLCTCTIFWDTV